MTTFADGKPEPIVNQLIELLPAGAEVLDLGCGEGRNSLPLARHGMRVVGWDKCVNELALLKRQAHAEALRVHAVHCDMRDLHIEYGKWHAILTILSLHYLKPEEAAERLLRIRAKILPGGFHAMVAFTNIGTLSKLRNDRFFPKKEEILEAYEKADWEIVTYEADMVNCLQTTASGQPHQNERLTLLARKPANAQAA